MAGRINRDAFPERVATVPALAASAVSTADAEKLAACDLAHLPVFDGMAAARGRLYLSMNGGKVFCMGAKPWTESRRRKNDHEKLLTS